MIFLVHHADAVLPGEDPMRPLSSRGRATAQLLALEAARLGVKPVCVWHSGKLRARQTAEAFWRACNPLATLTAERGLQPTDPAEWMRDRFLGETRDVLAVGHMPNLPRLLRLLLNEDPESSSVAFPLHGVVALEPQGEAGMEKWVERWRLDPVLLTSGT